MAGLPPPPPPPPPGGSGPPPPDVTPASESDSPPSGPPIRRPDATLPQPEPPVETPPEGDARAERFRQLLAAGVVLLAVAGLVVAIVAGANALFVGEDDDLDTTAAIDELGDVLADAESGDVPDVCPVDLEAIVESVAEPLDSDVVFDALDLGDGDTPVTFDHDNHAAAINCARVRDDEAGIAVTAAIVDDADADIDELLGDLFDEDADITSGAPHRGGRFYEMEQIDDVAPDDNAIGAVWTDDQLIVGLFVGGAAEEELGTDTEAVRAQLERHLDGIVDDLGD